MNELLSPLKTPRLTIKELSPEDIPNVHALHSLPETDRFNTLGIPEDISVTREIVQKWLDDQAQQPRTSYVYCIFLNDLRQFIGLIAIVPGKSNFRNAEVWYKIHADHWKKGYTTEALNSVLKFGCETLKLHRIEAGCAVENTASIRVLEKAGMTREGLKRKNLPIRGEWKDSYFYSITEEDDS
jgi:ribosomal-protein-alanine N-acetyltransferase